MKFFKYSTTGFRCFSPTVMMLTFIVEICLAVYVAIKNKPSVQSVLIVSMLLCLALFQLAEYGLCEIPDISQSIWARLGFTAITLLPPLGLHFVLSLTKKSYPKLLTLTYTIAVAWILAFIFGGIVTSFYCGGNYVLFDLSWPASILYFIYYHVYLLGASYLAIVASRKRIKKATKHALISIVIGYAAFIIPTSISITLFTKSTDGLPSIMCGFAVIYALIIGLYTRRKV